MNDTSRDLDQSEIILARHRTTTTIDRLRSRVESFFLETEMSYTSCGIDSYREIVQACQDKLNEDGSVREIVSEIYDDLYQYVDGDRFLTQTNLYLRATRPQVTQSTEAIGWHRETFYGPNMEKSINVWTPIKGVVESNTLRFIPKSQLIPENEIVTEQYEDPVTRKGSTGNILGFLYAPKKIISGVDLSRALPMNVPDFYSGIFPGNLIHGSATNASNEIRFSVDFRVIPLRFYDKSTSKQIHAASGKPYFEEY